MSDAMFKVNPPKIVSRVLLSSSKIRIFRHLRLLGKFYIS